MAPLNHYNLVWNLYLVFARLWLGRVMVLGGQSILRFFSSKELQDFFENWFGNELGLPAPLLMAFLAKGSEFLFGIFVIVGLFTRVSSIFLAFVMMVATLVANLDYSGVGPIIRQDGLLTISCFLFAALLANTGAGKFSLDYLLFGRRPANDRRTFSSPTPNNSPPE